MHGQKPVAGLLGSVRPQGPRSECASPDADECSNQGNKPELGFLTDLEKIGRGLLAVL